jgi:hypothetical protein
MINRYFAIVLIILITLSGFFVIQTKFLAIQVSFPMALYIYSINKNNDSNGTASVDTSSLSFSASNWPYFGVDKYNFKLQQPFQQVTPRYNLVVFNLIIKLNNTQHTLSINEFKDAGRYYGTITCYFVGVQSGNYILTLNLTVDGLVDNDFYLAHVITVT